MILSGKSIMTKLVNLWTESDHSHLLHPHQYPSNQQLKVQKMKIKSSIKDLIRRQELIFAAECVQQLLMRGAG